MFCAKKIIPYQQPSIFWKFAVVFSYLLKD